MYIRLIVFQICKRKKYASSSETLPINSNRLDSQGAIKMARINASGNRTKHAKMKYDLIQNCESEKKLILQCWPNGENSG